MIQHIYTAMNRHGPYTEHLKESAYRNGISIEMLGMGIAHWGLNVKLHLMYEKLRGVRGPVMFVDGWDTIFVSDMERIYHLYKWMDSPPILMSAEANCAPDESRAGEYPQAPTRYRYLNAGCWIGDAQYMRHHLHEMKVWRLPAEMNDQRVLTDYYLSHLDSMLLDYHCAIFQSLFIAQQDLTCVNGHIENTITKTRPCVIHGNGGVDMSKVLRWANLID